MGEMDGSEVNREGGRSLRVVGALFLLAIAAHHQALGHAFTWNDGVNLVDNDAIRSTSNIPSFFVSAWGSEAADDTYRERNSQYWRPIALTLWTVIYALGGLNPALFHALSLLLHGLTAAIVGLFAYRLWPRPGPYRDGALLGAAIWAVHPVHSEVIQVVSYQSDLLAGLSVILGLYLWIRAEGLSVTGRRWTRRLAVPMCYAIGVGSKEMAVTLPALLVMLDWATSSRIETFKTRALDLLPTVAVGLGYLVVRQTLLAPGGHRFFGDASGLEILWTMLDVVALYGRLLIAPWPLNPFYDWSVLPVQPSLLALGPMLGLGCLIGCLWAASQLRRRDRRYALCLLLPWVALLPVSHIVPIIIAAAERFLYIASIGPLFLLGIGLRHSTSAPVRRITATCLLGLFLSLSVIRSLDWRTDRTILEANVRDWPTSFNAHYGLAQLHEREERFEEAARLFEALGLDARAEHARERLQR